VAATSWVSRAFPRSTSRHPGSGQKLTDLERGGPPADDLAEDAGRTWTAAGPGVPPTVDWASYQAEPRARIAAPRTGFVRLRVPVR
jgi:hypothetical protein